MPYTVVASGVLPMVVMRWLPGRCTRAGRARPLWLNLPLSHRGQCHLVFGSATKRMLEAIGVLGLVEENDVVVLRGTDAGRHVVLPVGQTAAPIAGMGGDRQ